MAVALLAAACGSSSGPAESLSSAAKVVHLTWWTANSDQSEITYIDSHFNATHRGIRVKGQYAASSDDIEAKEVSALKSGTEPNVIFGQDPSELPFLAESGKVVNLKGRSPALDRLTKQLYGGIRDALFFKGKQLGMALGGVGDVVLFYNKTDFAAAGISRPPATWAQLTQDARKLTDPAKHRYGIYIPLGDAEWISYDWEALLWADGGALTNKAGTKATFDSPAGVRALTTWVDLIRKYHAAPTTSYAQAGSYDGAPAFAGNAVAMIIEGQFALNTFQTAHVNFGVAPFPKGTKGGSTNIGIGVATEFNHGSTQDKAATTFIQWLAEPAQGAYLTATSGGLPSSPVQLSQPAVKKLQASESTYSVFANDLKLGKTRPTIPGYDQLSTDLWNHINLALTGKETPAQALHKAQSEADKALSASKG